MISLGPFECKSELASPPLYFISYVLKSMWFHKYITFQILCPFVFPFADYDDKVFSFVWVAGRTFSV